MDAMRDFAVVPNMAPVQASVSSPPEIEWSGGITSMFLKELKETSPEHLSIKFVCVTSFATSRSPSAACAT